MVVFTSSPGAPGMRCRKLRGETAPFEAGRYATHGERNRVSVVAFAISSTEPASGVSGANDCAHARWGSELMRASRPSSA